MRRFLVVVALLLAASPAAAHKLRLFATVEGNAVSGYAWFVGGGRAQDMGWVARSEDGAEIASGQTDAEGRYRFAAPDPVTGPITIIADTREGHVARAELGPERFGPAAPAAVNPGSVLASGARPMTAAPPDLAPVVEAAVQRQVAPLLERIEEMDSRMRVTDVVSGLFLIIGLAGVALHLRRRG